MKKCMSMEEFKNEWCQKCRNGKDTTINVCHAVRRIDNTYGCIYFKPYETTKENIKE